MAQYLQMLALSPTMEEGTINNWHKKEGDSISAGEVLADIETDKATMEYESPETGTILKLIVPPGSAARVGEPIAIIGQKGEDISSMVPQNAVEEKKAPQAQELEKVKDHAAQPTELSEAASALRSTPAARKLAQDKGLDLSSIKGSGPQGRITEKDVIQAVTSQVPPRIQQPQAVKPTHLRTEQPRLELQDKTVSLSPMRKTIAKRLSESKFSAPDYYVRIKAAVDTLIAARQQLNKSRQDKISLNAFFIKLCSEAIQRHPIINSSFAGDSIITHGKIDIALAVAVPDGLVAPVIRSCHGKGILDIDSELKLLVEGARSGSLKPEDFSDATFTISNLGSYGVDEFTAIINPPGSAILAIGAIERQSVILDNGIPALRSIIKLTLTCDHRVIDGAQAAEFLNTLRAFIENPFSTLY